MVTCILFFALVLVLRRNLRGIESQFATLNPGFAMHRCISAAKDV